MMDFINSIGSKLQELFKTNETKLISPLPSSTPTPTQNPLQQQIERGISKYDQTMPIATLSAPLAKVGQGLPDSLLPVILALMESGGGRNITSGANNLYNISPGQGITYPDLATAILGGGQRNQLGLKGVLEKNYPDYLRSGNLTDFFSRFTPESDLRNPSIEESIKRYNLLRTLFE